MNYQKRRTYLRKWEVKRFVMSYVYEKPFDLEQAILSARPDFVGIKKGELVRMGEVALSNSYTNGLISVEFEKILKESNIDSAKKKFLEILLKAEKLAEDESDSESMRKIAIMWGQMAQEYGIRQTITKTQEATGKLDNDLVKKLEAGRIKMKQTTVTESGGE